MLLPRRTALSLMTSLLVWSVSSCSEEPPKQSLIDAAAAGNAAKCAALVKEGVPVNSADSAGRTALHWAVGQQHLEVVRKLIELGADVNQADTHSHATPLMYTAMALSSRGYSPSTQGVRNEIAKLLIKHGADVNRAIPHGDTVLHRAVVDRNPELIRVLLQAGADRNAKTLQGYTPLDIAKFPAYAPNQAVIDALEGRAEGRPQ